MQQLSKSQLLTVAVLKKNVGTKSKNWLKDGITFEFTEFTDYSQPNKATADGEVDLNAFQHYNFLNNWNKENGKDLVAIADTYISQSAFTQV